MRQYFYPPTVLIHDKTKTSWDLTVMKSGKLGLLDQYGVVRPLVNAKDFTVLERRPVLGEKMRAILGLWLMFAIEMPDGSLSASGFTALEEAEAMLRAGGFLEENGQPRQESRATALMGAGGIISEKEGKQ